MWAFGRAEYTKNHSRIKMCVFFKVVKGATPSYLTSLVSQTRSMRNTSFLLSNIPARTKRYKQSFFPSSIYLWNNMLTAKERSYPSLNLFKSQLYLRIKISKTINFGLKFYDDLKEINQLRVGLSPLRQHKFLHHFTDIANDACICGKPEDSTHFFRECPLFLPYRRVLCSKIFTL